MNGEPGDIHPAALEVDQEKYVVGHQPRSVSTSLLGLLLMLVIGAGALMILPMTVGICFVGWLIAGSTGAVVGLGSVDIHRQYLARCESMSMSWYRETSLPLVREV